MAWVQEQRAGADKNASGLASDVAPRRAGREICRREPQIANPARYQRVRKHAVSSCHLLAWGCVAVELTEQASRSFLAASASCWTKFSTCSRVASLRALVPQKSTA